MAIYPSTLPCPLLSGNNMQGGATFIRSDFDHSIRQRKNYCSNYSVMFSFIMKDRVQMQAFKEFYYSTLENGVFPFTASWEIEGSIVDKEFRFNSIYNAKAIGIGKYSVNASFDLMTNIKDI